MASKKRKPLSFSTTLRNPERIPQFLECLKDYDNQVLTHDVIINIVKNIINSKYYKPLYVKRTPLYNDIYEDDSKNFNDRQLNDILINSPQKHKEKGFDYGWESRFDTFYKLLKELGFIYYLKNEKIQISELGNLMIEAYTNDEYDYFVIQKIYLNSLVRFQTNSPFRKNLNNNRPLPLLLELLLMLKNDNKNGLPINLIPILLCWQNSDAEELYNYISTFQKKNKRYSSEKVYETCLELLETNNRKLYKYSKICHESVDEYIRKMRMTGLISLRGNGYYIDVNSNELDTIKYIVLQYIEPQTSSDEKEYFLNICKKDPKLLKVNASNISINFAKTKADTLKKYSKLFSNEDLATELKILSNRRESKNPILKYIPAPTRLEFLTSIILEKHLLNVKIEPNYSVDDEGLPTFTAPGGVADIVCKGSNIQANFEVTMMCGRSDQVNNEIIPIARHLKDIDSKITSFAVLIAPIIHEDTKEAADWQNYKHKLDILTFSIDSFIEKVSTVKELADFI